MAACGPALGCGRRRRCPAAGSCGTFGRRVDRGLPGAAERRLALPRRRQRPGHRVARDRRSPTRSWAQGAGAARLRRRRRSHRRELRSERARLQRRQLHDHLLPQDLHGERRRLDRRAGAEAAARRRSGRLPERRPGGEQQHARPAHHATRRRRPRPWAERARRVSKPARSSRPRS